MNKAISRLFQLFEYNVLFYFKKQIFWLVPPNHERTKGLTPRGLHLGGFIPRRRDQYICGIIIQTAPTRGFLTKTILQILFLFLPNIFTFFFFFLSAIKSWLFNKSFFILQKKLILYQKVRTKLNQYKKLFYFLTFKWNW